MLGWVLEEAKDIVEGNASSHSEDEGALQFEVLQDYASAMAYSSLG